MNIDVKSLNASIYTDRKYTSHNEYEIVDKLGGEVKVSVNSERITKNVFLHADQSIDIQALSPEAQQKIIEAFTAIKNELNEGLN